MRINFSGFELQQKSKQAAQTGGTRWTVTRNPNRIGNYYRIRAQARLRFGNYLFEVWRTNLFFKLPQETNIDWNARFLRGARSKESRERRALVVSRATTQIGVALLGH
jgi:hypothetical protein